MMNDSGREYKRPPWFIPNAKYGDFDRLNAWILGGDDGGPDTKVMVRQSGRAIEILGETYDSDDGVEFIEVLATLPVAFERSRGMLLVSQVCLHGAHSVCDIADQSDCQCRCHSLRENGKKPPEHLGRTCQAVHGGSLGLSHTGWQVAMTLTSGTAPTENNDG